MSMWGRLSTCGRLAIGLSICKPASRPINNRSQDTILPHIGEVN
jgi:hypothetical protein